MYKLVISDLDGTLLNAEHELTLYTKNTVKKLVDKGIKFFIATGRHHIDAMDIKYKLGLDKAYLISSNGARVHDYEGKLLIEHNHNKKVARDIINMSISPKVHLNVYFDDNWYVFAENERIKEWVEKTAFKYTKIKKEELEYDKILKWYYLGEHEDLVEVKEKIDKNWGGEVECLFSLPVCLEIMPKGISKGKAIEEIIEKEGIGREETMAFGDGFNDYDMLNFVQKGLVMENAHDKLKESLSHLEIIGHHSKDAVARYLEGYFSL
jgi:hypothetical protein